MPDIKQIQQLDLNLLKVFVSLYQHQNMTRTAEALYLTPSAVSHAVKRLRNALDDPLFERAHNKMIPTPVCQRLAPLVTDTLSRLQQILQQAGDFDPSNSQQHVTIAMHDALEISVLPALVSALREQAPSISLSSVRVERTQLSRELASGRIDLALDVALPVKDPLLHMRCLTDGFVVMAHRYHPFLARPERSGYFEARHLVVSSRPAGASLEDLMLQAQGFSRLSTLRCQNYHAARELLRESPLLLTLPGTLAAHLCTADFGIVPVPVELAWMETHLYWHRQTENDAGLSWFRALIMDCCTTLQSKD